MAWGVNANTGAWPKAGMSQQHVEASPHDMVFAAWHSKIREDDTPVDEATRDQHEAGTMHSSSGGEPASDQMAQVCAFHICIYIYTNAHTHTHQKTHMHTQTHMEWGTYLSRY